MDKYEEELEKEKDHIATLLFLERKNIYAVIGYRRIDYKIHKYLLALCPRKSIAAYYRRYFIRTNEYISLEIQDWITNHSLIIELE